MISIFSSDIQNFIQEKRALGYKYDTEEAMLKRFDAFCSSQHPKETTLSSNIVLDWAKKRPNEKPATQQVRISPVNELVKYMIRMGKPAYVLPKGMLPLKQKYIPHIYSNEELKKIWNQVDQCQYCSIVPYRHFVMPVFFRTLYCCGTRLTETRMLRNKDVDLERGVITLLHTKSEKHRQIPISDNLLKLYLDYANKVHLFTTPDDLIFSWLSK